ncbi:hypothetical protein VTI74DRAFT_7598 [Chaetomium olivicolor]
MTPSLYVHTGRWLLTQLPSRFFVRPSLTRLSLLIMPDCWNQDHAVSARLRYRVSLLMRLCSEAASLMYSSFAMAFLYVCFRMSTYMPPPHVVLVQYWYIYASSSIEMFRYVAFPVRSNMRIMASPHLPVSSVESPRKSPPPWGHHERGALCVWNDRIDLVHVVPRACLAHVVDDARDGDAAEPPGVAW